MAHLLPCLEIAKIQMTRVTITNILWTLNNTEPIIPSGARAAATPAASTDKKKSSKLT